MESPTYLSPRTHASAMPLERKKVGEVFHFYGKIGVAAIRLTDSTLAIGDTVQIQGPTTNVEQTVDTLQIEHADVPRADVGQEVGMKVRERVREKDFVYKLVEERLRARAPHARVDEHELEPVGPVEQRAADQGEEEQPHQRALPQHGKHGIRGGIGRPQAERRGEEQ